MVHRADKKTDYTVIANAALKDKRLSFRARGLLVTMLSLPDTWDFSVGGLSRLAPEGRDAISKTLKELENAGYLKRSRKRDAHGKLCEAIFDIYEVPPITEKPVQVKPTLEKPSQVSPTQENPTQLNTNIIDYPINKILTDKERGGASSHQLSRSYRYVQSHMHIASKGKKPYRSAAESCQRLIRASLFRRDCRDIHGGGKE